MNKKFNILMKSLFFILMITLTSPAFSIFDISFGLGYTKSGIDYKDELIPDKKYHSFGGELNMHLNFGIPKVISFGIGPYISVGQFFTNEDKEGNPTFSRIGGDIQAVIKFLPEISPYLRLGYGLARLEQHSFMATSQGGEDEVTIPHMGGAFHSFLGIKLPDYYNLFFETGITYSSISWHPEPESESKDIWITNYINNYDANWKAGIFEFKVNVGIGYDF